MADLMITESCPCGAQTDVRGYASDVRTQIDEWRKMHRLHMARWARQQKEATAEALDLMAALKASLEDARARRDNNTQEATHGQ